MAMLKEELSLHPWGVRSKIEKETCKEKNINWGVNL